MELSYLISDKYFNKLLANAENELLNGERIKFKKGATWRREYVPDFPGVYALFDKNELLYIGETGNLRERMNDVFRTVNHTFRRQLAKKRFGAGKTKKKFDGKIEALLDAFFDDDLYVSFVKSNFGRVEIETALVTKYQMKLLNSIKKRKLKRELDEVD